MVPSAAAARCLQQAHTIRTLPGVTGVLSVFFVPGDRDLRPLTLTFDVNRNYTSKFYRFYVDSEELT